MLKLKKDSKRSPFGGHHYPEYGRTFQSPTFKELVKNVEDFRLNNNIPAGDPEQDILAFYAEHWPWLIEVNFDEPAPGWKKVEHYEDWRESIYKMWKRPPLKTISVKEASDRWAVCAVCPYNKPLDWEETNESAELSRRTFLLRRGIDVPENLGYCSLHKVDLSVFCLIADASDYSSKTEEDYEACWLKT